MTAPALIEIDTLAKRRFADPTPELVRRLKYLARRAQLPGARKIGARWYCDLTVFDQPEAPAASPLTPSVAEMVAAARAARSAT